METAFSAIRAMKDTGRKVVGCFPLYPPLELLHSMGLTPALLWGLRDSYRSVPLSDRHLQVYTCSVGRCMAEFILHYGSELLDGLFMYNACDTLRNLPEILQSGLAGDGCTLPMFKLHIPTSPLSSATDREYFRNRIHRLIHEIEEAYGVTFSGESFVESIDLYRKQRGLTAELQSLAAQGRIPFIEFCRIAGLGCYIPVEEHIEILKQAIEHGSADPMRDSSFSKIMVSGILPPSPGIIDCIEKTGLKVVDNDIAMFKRSYGYIPSSINEPAEYYIDLYGNHYPCTTMLHTSDARIEEIRMTVRNGGVKGFIFIGEKFCEYEYFEIPHLRKVLEEEGVRMLCLDFSLEDDEHIGSHQTRIETFAETLRG